MLQRRHFIRVFLFVFRIFNQLNNRFRKRFTATLRKASQTLPDDKFQIDRFFARMLVFRIKMALPSGPNGLLHAIDQFRIHMLVNPTIYQHGFIFQREQLIDGFLGGTGFYVTGD